MASPYAERVDTVAVTLQPLANAAPPNEGSAVIATVLRDLGYD